MPGSWRAIVSKRSTAEDRRMCRDGACAGTGGERCGMLRRLYHMTEIDTWARRLNRHLLCHSTRRLIRRLTFRLPCRARLRLACGLLLAGLVLLGSFTQADAHDERAAPPHLPFYIATKSGQTIYVLGTLHVGYPSDFPAYQPFRPVIVNALSASGTLAFELSPDDTVMSPDSVTRDGVCPRDCLRRMLPAALWQRLVARLRGDPAALAEIRRMKPWLAALVIETISSQQAGLQTEYGTEAQLENIYLRGSIVGLESMDDQMRAFTGLSLPEQWEMLAQDLTQTPAEDVADVRKLHALWLAGDADKLAAWQAAKTATLMHTPELAHALDERIVFRRNRHFVVKMLLIASPGHPLFVAIGALHLGGPQGVLALLRSYGFSVKAG